MCTGSVLSTRLYSLYCHCVHIVLPNNLYSSYCIYVHRLCTTNQNVLIILPLCTLCTTNLSILIVLPLCTHVVYYQPVCTHCATSYIAYYQPVYTHSTASLYRLYSGAYPEFSTKGGGIKNIFNYHAQYIMYHVTDTHICQFSKVLWKNTCCNPQVTVPFFLYWWNMKIEAVNAQKSWLWQIFKIIFLL